MPTSYASRRSTRTKGLIGAGAVMILVGGIAIPVAAASSPPKPVTIHFVSVTKKSLRVPTGGADVDVSETRAGKVTGSDTLNCRGTSESTLTCAFTLDLSGGELLGSVTPTKDGATGRILAGTGKYADKTGTISAHNLSQTRTSVLITLAS